MHEFARREIMVCEAKDIITVLGEVFSLKVSLSRFHRTVIVRPAEYVEPPHRPRAMDN